MISLVGILENISRRWYKVKNACRWWISTEIRIFININKYRVIMNTSFYIYIYIIYIFAYCVLSANFWNLIIFIIIGRFIVELKLNHRWNSSKQNEIICESIWNNHSSQLLTNQSHIDFHLRRLMKIGIFKKFKGQWANSCINVNHNNRRD